MILCFLLIFQIVIRYILISNGVIPLHGAFIPITRMICLRLVAHITSIDWNGYYFRTSIIIYNRLINLLLLKHIHNFVRESNYFSIVLKSIVNLFVFLL